MENKKLQGIIAIGTFYFLLGLIFSMLSFCEFFVVRGHPHTVSAISFGLMFILNFVSGVNFTKYKKWAFNIVLVTLFFYAFSCLVALFIVKTTIVAAAFLFLFFCVSPCVMLYYITRSEIRA